MCVAAWFLASGEESFTRQSGPASLAVVGLLVGLYAHVGWILTGRRVIGLRAHTLLGDAPSVTHGPRTAGEALLVGAPGMRYFHRAGCSMAEGRAWAAAARQAHTRAGRQPCGMCQP